MSCHRSREIYRKGVGAGAAQGALFCLPLSEALKDEPLVLALGELVERVIGPVLRRDFPIAGGYSYDPAALFAVWMFGIMKGVASTRALEGDCRYDDRFRHLCKGCLPDHTTLSRFRRSLGERMDELMRDVAEAAMEAGWLKLRQVAADGTKLAAACTQWRVRAEAMDNEPEAQKLRTPHGDYIMGYNLQAAVDMETGFIAAFEAVDEANDLRGLEPLMRQMERQCPKMPEALVADKGFDSLPNAHALDSRQIAGYLPRCRGSCAPFSLGADGVFRCLAGHIPLKSLRKRRDHEFLNLRVSQCRHCSHRQACGLKTGHQRQMQVPLGEPIGDRRAANLRCDTPDGRTLMKARGPTVELLFARLKQQLGLRRFRLRHKDGVRLEFGLYALALNLRLLMEPFWRFFPPFCPSVYDSPHRSLRA